MRKIPRRDVEESRMRFSVSGFYFPLFFSLSSAGIQRFFMTNVWNVMPLATVSECASLCACVYMYGSWAGLLNYHEKLLLDSTWIKRTSTHTKSHMHTNWSQTKRPVWLRACLCVWALCACSHVCWARWVGELTRVRALSSSRAYTHTYCPSNLCVCVWIVLHEISLTLATNAIRQSTNRVLFSTSSSWRPAKHAIAH